MDVMFIKGIILTTSILVQLITAFLAIKLIRVTGMHIAWLLIALALFFMALRRFISLSWMISGEVVCHPDPAAEFVALVTSILMLLGVAWIAPLFLSITRSKEELKKSEEKSRATSLYIRSLFEASLDPLTTISPDGRIMDVNHAAEAVTGVYRGSLIGSEYSDLFTEPEKAREAYQQVFLQGSITDNPLAIRHVSGSVTDVLCNATVFRNEAESVQGVFVTARDITRHKIAEERIKHLSSVLGAIRNVNQLIVMEKEKESLLQKTCDALIKARSYDAAWLGFIENGGNFTIVKGSGLLKDVSRLSKDVMGGDYPCCIKKAMSWKEKVLVVDRTIECKDCPFRDAHSDREAVIIRIEHANSLFGLLAILLAPDVALDAEEVELLKDVASDLGLGLCNMGMEEALRVSEVRFRSLLENIPNVSIQGYRPDGTVRYWNKASETVYGYTAREAIGNNLIDLIIPPEMRDRVRKTIKHGAQTGEMPPVSEISLMRKDGTLVPLLTSHVVVQQPGQEPELFCIDVDLTELKRAENQVKASLKEKDVLLREIHHRVKNNLQVLSSLFNIQARTVKDKDMINAFSESRSRINAMALVHAQLYESKDLSEINMKGFIEKLLIQLFHSYPVQKIKITRIVSIADRPFPISIATPVGLIINELISNALKHAFIDRKEGKIKIILNVSDKSRIDLTISDDGIGLPEGFDIDKTRTLGIRLVKILVENQLQGHLEVTDKEGTTFNIKFDIETDGEAYL